MSTLVLSAISNAPEFVIEEHVAATNDFLQLSRLTLDDLNCYGKPLSDVARLVMRGAHKPVSDAEVMEVVRLAMAEYRGIDYDLEAAAEVEDRANGLLRAGD